MRHERTGDSSGFGSRITETGKKIIIFYGIIYVLELLFEHWFEIPIVSYLQLYPMTNPYYHTWQLFTHLFIQNPESPFAFIISCIMLYFFAAPVENAFGTKKFLILFYTSAAGGAVCGLCLSGVSGFNAPFLGMMPSLLSLIVVFGLLNPEATILLMFILPVKAKYLSYGTIIITFLTFLAKANPNGAYHLGGILFGYLYFRGYTAYFDPRYIYLKYLVYQLIKKRSRLLIINGNKESDDDEPTYH
jgi:membrane associated rhomboid family serine protease